jgi:hypothetical protein
MLTLVSPWWIRNCLVLGALMPLGAQGFMELPTGFSDTAVEKRGVWFRLQDTGFYDQPLLGIQREMNRPEVERLAADYGRASVAAWVRANPDKLPALTAQKIWSEWKPPGGITGALVLFAALFAITFVRGSNLSRACVTMVLGDLLMIAATWSVEGRFVFPVAVPLYALAGIGIWLMFCAISDLRGELQRQTGIGTPAAN